MKTCGKPTLSTAGIRELMLFLFYISMNMNTQFILHPTLANDTIFVGSLEISDVLLMKDSRYPWIILVPRIAGVSDITQLDAAIRNKFNAEINDVAAAMKNHLKPDRMNIAMLGNIVPQLHCHIIARFETDFAWAKPVWGIGEAVAYTEEQLEQMTSIFRNLLI